MYIGFRRFPFFLAVRYRDDSMSFLRGDRLKLFFSITVSFNIVRAMQTYE